MEYAVEIKNLSKEYETGFWKKTRVRALDDVTLNVKPGQIFGFLGGNGAGKTTTIKTLMRLIFPTEGSAKILGHDISDVQMHRRIGYCPENPYFYDYLTAEELLSYFASLMGYDRAEIRRRVSARLDEVGIAGERRLQLRKFSKGMLQRVGIAQALINDPEVVFLDEPMSGLDPLGRREVRHLILRLRDKGCTVFFSSHVLSDAETLCSRVAILTGGKLVTTGRIADLRAFQVHGWEMIVANVTPASLERHRGRVQRATAIGEQRYSLELPLAPPPDLLLRDLQADGAHLVSLNPLRETLEDFFVKKVAEQPNPRMAASRERP